ncbi:MAG TPA: DUF3857 domain-containing protein [Polyangiaceae bacterium]|nr:DUF3857 domain-containing protein [Polyangiaceae bacterium]
MRRAPYLFLSAALALAAVGCGHARHPGPPTIQDLRRRARLRPQDPMAARALAEGEMLLEGSDPARAAAAIERATQLDGDNVRLLFLGAIERELHGDPSAALHGFLRVIEQAARSRDPLGPSMAAIAAAEIESLDDAVDGFVPQVTEALTPLHAQPGRIGDEARSTIADLLIDLSYRAGDLERVQAIVQAQRCVVEWRIAGPFGPRHLLSYDTELAPDADATLADEYNLGPSRGVRSTRDARARGCQQNIGGGPVGGAGTTFVESTVQVPSAGRWVLRLETPNAVRVSVDGEEVVALDRRREALPRVTYHPLTLTAGPHAVRVRITSRHPNPVVALSLSQTAGPASGAELTGTGPLTAFVRAQSAIVRGDVVRARELLRPSVQSREAAPLLLIAAAAAALNDPLRGSTERHDTARRLLTWAHERDERAWYAHLALAQLEANEGRSEVAIHTLQDGMQRWPELVVMPLQLIDYLSQRGWHAQVEQTVARAREAVPSACRPLRAALTYARRRHRAALEMQHARALVQCDARSDALFSLLVRQRRWDAARAELARLTSLQPGDIPLNALQAELDIANSRDDQAEVGRLLTQLLERIPLSAPLVQREADRLLARGDREGALARLTAALEAEPEAMMDLRRGLRAIGGGSPLEAYRRDGTQVIRDLEASDRSYDEPMVLVFDYTVYRVFEDGSMLELTHNIYRLQSQEAVNAMGEFHVPENAQMLTLRTVKEDGTRLEPDEIAGKETISFPSLSPGDYIEFEYLRPRPAPAGYPGGFAGDRFYFQNFETPFDHSQLTVIVPRDVELMIDPRGPAPETQTSIEGETRVYRWAVQESRPLRQEPSAVSAREFFPSINWGHGATWDLYVESLRDVLADRNVIDPAAQRLVATIIGDDRRATVEQRAARLRSWVLENVENNADVFGLAPAMLAARAGNRTRVLHYLLRLAGIEAELALARSYAADATHAELPDDDTYQNLIVRMRGSDGWRWLHAGAHGAPFDYIPPPLAGMDALLLDASAARVTVAERALEADLHSVDVDVLLRRDGGARVTVVETYRGAGAVSWRNQLEEVPDEHLEAQFESQYVANMLPGGELTRLVITGREDAEGPLVLRYDVQLAALARESGRGWVVPSLFPARLAPTYARVASRTLTQLIAAGLAVDVQVRVQVPQGASFESVPEHAVLHGAHGAEVELSASRSPTEVTVRRRYRVPRMRITAQEYGEFAQFCRASDEAEGAEIQIRM